MFLTPYKRHAISVLAAVTLLSGCGLTQRVTDGTKEVASAIFYKQIKNAASRFCIAQRAEYRCARHTAFHDDPCLATENT